MMNWPNCSALIKTSRGDAKKVSELEKVRWGGSEPNLKGGCNLLSVGNVDECGLLCDH